VLRFAHVPVATPVRVDSIPAPGHVTREGDVIGSKYRLTKQMAEGGMGTVWLARNMTLHVDVAIKLIRREIAGSQEAAQRLLNEARATAQLDHPAIVKMHDFGETELGHPYIVMELLKGDTFEQLIAADVRPPPIYVVQILLPIIDALQVAHEEGIVHRDLKPDNIFLVTDKSGDLFPKLVDFGVAKLRDRTVERDAGGGGVSAEDSVKRTMTMMGDLIGSPQYMAPEQALGDSTVDGRADLWAICVVLYEAINGSRPFNDERGLEVLLMQILKDEPAPPDPRWMDDALWKIVKKGLSKQRDDRWQTAEELGRALAAWLMSKQVDTDVTGRSLKRKWLKPSSMPPSMAADVDDRPSVANAADAAPTRGAGVYWLAATIALLVIAAAAVKLLSAHSVESTTKEPAVTPAVTPVPARPNATATND
jgi:serine/threonine protein kinase